MIAECPKCKVPLVVGKAIQSHDGGWCWWWPQLISAASMKIIDCLKCPKCGHSDDGQ